MPDGTYHRDAAMAIYLEVDLERRAHGGLDVKHLDVLPVLLEEGDKEVDSELDVEGDLGRSHGHVGDGKGHAHHLLHLELDGGLGGIDLLLEVISLIKDGRELAGLGQTRTKDTRDLLDQRVGGKEVIVLLGELLDELLVLVELLQVIDGHLVNAKLIGLLAVLLVTKNADAGVGAGDGRELKGTGETLVTGRIVVLQGDLELDGLGELAGLALKFLALGGGDGLASGEAQHLLDGSAQKISAQLAHFCGTKSIFSSRFGCAGVCSSKSQTGRRGRVVLANVRL